MASETVVLTGRILCEGQVEGEALVTQEPVAWFNNAMEDDTGVIVRDGHELEGVHVNDKILVFDMDIGSTGGSFGFYNKARNGVGPRGLIYREALGISASGAIYADVPAMDRINEGIPYEIIETGDWVKMDATSGSIVVSKAGIVPLRTGK